jgi:hypothetical protein
MSEHVSEEQPTEKRSDVPRAPSPTWPLSDPSYTKGYIPVAPQKKYRFY